MRNYNLLSQTGGEDKYRLVSGSPWIKQWEHNK